MSKVTLQRLLLVLIFCSLLFTPSCTEEGSSLSKQRERMIDHHLKRRGISDPIILKAFETTPREEFVQPKYRDAAYDDAETPTVFGQTLERPYEDAIMLKALSIEPGDKVLEVGTGSGYLSALTSRIAGNVYTIEIEPEIAEVARKKLAKLGFKNVEVKTGDGFLGWAERAPFDAIILRCSPPRIPKPLEEQLAEGGRMLIPLGGSEKFQELVLYEKRDGKLIEKRRIAPTTFSPMKGKILESEGG